MAEKEPQIITVADLLRLSRPVTGAASLFTSPSPLPSKKAKLSFPLLDPKPSSSRSFAPLNYPSYLTGTISLPSSASSCNSRCLTFSDTSAEPTTTVCCSFLDFEPELIGRRIHVTAWNFLPLKNHNNLLEIISWKFPKASDIQLRSHHSADGLVVQGVLAAVSPVFMVPDNHGNQVLGFLAEIREIDSGPAFIYFVEPNHMWQSAVSKLVGKGIEISGLKKKTIHVGGKSSYVMFVTMEKIKISCCRTPVSEMLGGLGEKLSVYHGVVTGIYMQGMVIELDGKVWLVADEMLLPLQHSLRVGSIVSVQNFYMLHVHFSWTRVYLLETSIRTTIIIKSFSPSETRCYLRTQSLSLLGNFISSLTLSSRFWMLLLICCFRRKFAGIFSDEEILGSIKREGLTQIYARSTLLANSYKVQDGLFMDFCNHDRHVFKGMRVVLPLKLVVPLSGFLSICESLWLSRISEIQEDFEDEGITNQFSCEGTSYCSTIRKIISSDDLGFTLIGVLKISSSSGRLELVDATGSVDIIVPDLISESHLNIVHEVKVYRVVLEGLPVQTLGCSYSQPNMCRKIFEQFQYKKMLKELVVYVHFYMRDSNQLNVSFPLPSCMSIRNFFGDYSGRQHQLFLVTHKYPAVRINEDVPNAFSFFAEAIVLPYELVFLEKNILEESDEILFNELRIDDVTSKKRTYQTPCLLAFRNSNFKCFLKLGTRFSKSLAGRRSVEYVTNKQFLQKVLLEFKSDCFNKYKLMNRGEVYILNSSEGTLLQTKAGYLHGAKLQVDCHTTVMGISIPFDKVACQEESPVNNFSGISHKVNARSPDCPQSELILQHSPDLILESSDDRLLLNFVPGELIKEKSKEVEDGFIHFIKLLKEPGSSLSVSSCIEVMRAQSTGSYEVSAVQGSKLSQGMLVSLTGNIENIHICGYGSNSDMNTSMTTSEMSYRICIHVRDGPHMVKIRGNLSKYHCPIGLGPGANATFHRVLITSCQNLMLSPVTFIVVNSVKEHIHQSSARGTSSGSRDYIRNNDLLDVVPLCLISQYLHCTKGKLVRSRCRVVAIHLLVLQSQTPSFVKGHSEYLVETLTTKIPLAGFVLDDGSSLCLGWADGSNAGTLLRMQEVQDCYSFHNYKRSNRARDKSYQNRTPRNSMYYYLEKILRKHDRVTVSNRGILPDLSCLDLRFSAASDKVLTSKEENFLKFIILDACSGPNFDLICCTTDLKGLHGFESERLQSATLSLPNVWLKEVYKVDPLKEAKDVLNELL